MFQIYKQCYGKNEEGTSDYYFLYRNIQYSGQTINLHFNSKALMFPIYEQFNRYKRGSRFHCYCLDNDSQCFGFGVVFIYTQSKQDRQKEKTLKIGFYSCVRILFCHSKKANMRKKEQNLNTKYKQNHVTKLILRMHQFERMITECVFSCACILLLPSKSSNIYKSTSYICLRSTNETM